MFENVIKIFRIYEQSTLGCKFFKADIGIKWLIFYGTGTMIFLICYFISMWFNLFYSKYKRNYKIVEFYNFLICAEEIAKMTSKLNIDMQKTG